MAATKSMIARWFREGKEGGASHLIVVCDTFDWSDYPVYVKPGENPKEIAKPFDGLNMQKIMEVYNLNLSMEEQTKHGRVMNY